MFAFYKGAVNCHSIQQLDHLAKDFVVRHGFRQSEAESLLQRIRYCGGTPNRPTPQPNLNFIPPLSRGHSERSILALIFSPTYSGCARFAQATLALKYIHEKHVLHRDLKPSNFFLSKSGTAGQESSEHARKGGICMSIHPAHALLLYCYIYIYRLIKVLIR